MSFPESWVLRINPIVFKALKKFPRHDAKAIWSVIKLLPADPYFGDIQKMKSQLDAWRRRVGSYRIFFKIKSAEKIILVFRLERRTSKTY